MVDLVKMEEFSLHSLGGGETKKGRDFWCVWGETGEGEGAWVRERSLVRWRGP
jgi:hypothetical protein